MKKNFFHIFIQLLLIALLSSIASADFFLQLGSFKFEQNAKQCIKKLIQWKYEAFIFEQKGRSANATNWYKVRVGPFSEKRKALKIKKEILSKKSFGNDIILIKTPGETPARVKKVDNKVNKSIQNKVPEKRTLASAKTKAFTYTEKATAPNHWDVTLEWDAIQDPDIAGYKINYDTDPEPPYNPDKSAWANEGPPPIIAGKNDTEIVLHGLDASKNYYFSIAPFNKKDAPQKSQHSDPTGSSTEALLEPADTSGQVIASLNQNMGKAGTVSDLTSTKRKKGFTLKWDAGDDPNISGYKIYYDTESGPPYTPDKEDWVDEGAPPIMAGKGVTEITIHGLKTDKDYYFSITAFHAKTGLESAYSEEVVVHSKLHTTDKPFAGVTPKEKSLPKTRKPVPVKPEESAKKSPVTLTLIDDTPEPGATGGVAHIYAGDVLRIDVPGQKEMSKNYDVDPEGSIYIISVGKVNVSDMDPAALVEKLTEALKKFITPQIQISVELLEQKRYINIVGGVRYPGWYRLSLLTNVDELIDMAGGILAGTDYTRIVLRRKTLDGYKELGVKGEITVFPSDILLVPMPQVYREIVDNGDLLFISIPQRQPPGRVPSTADTADLREVFARNQIEVDNNGYLYLPDYGHFYVAGMTPKEVKQSIIDRLPKYLAKLEKVEVSIIEKKHFVQVSGHVDNPGKYNIPESSNVQAALNEGGGATDGALMSGVLIKRIIRGKERILQVNLYQYNITGDDRLLTPIHEGDDIFVPITEAFTNVKRTLRSWDPPEERLEEDIKEKVRIFGAVRNPGIYEYVEDMDLLDLMLLASGETEYADNSKILIIRHDKVEEEFNLHAFLKYKGTEKGSLLVPQMRKGDTVYVRALEWKTAEPKEDKVFYVFGKVKRQGQYKLWDQMTVLQGVALAGGLDEWADDEHITIVRMVSGKQENIPFNFRKGVAGKFHELNISLQADDVIVVP